MSLTRRKKMKLISKLYREVGKMEPTPRQRPRSKEWLAAEGALRLMPLAGVSLPERRAAPRWHSMCCRVHEPGECPIEYIPHAQPPKHKLPRWVNRDRAGQARAEVYE